VNTLVLVMMIAVHAADIQDRDGAKLLIEKMVGLFPRLRLIWADGGYAGKLIDWVKATLGVSLTIIKRSDTAVGFEVIPKRWIVERTLGWFARYRRLSRDYEDLVENSEAMIHITMINVMLHRLAPG
jgi:putative transposase